MSFKMKVHKIIKFNDGTSKENDIVEAPRSLRPNKESKL